MVRAYVALGANMGDKAQALYQAFEALAKLPQTQVFRSSSLYKTAPLDTDAGRALPGPGDDYFNAVVALDTGLRAPDLLDHLQNIEQQAGRERSYRNAPRTLDLDLLLYGSACIDSVRLTVPHPRMAQRAFVLMPLAEIAPDLVSSAQLAAVAQQRVEKLGPPSGKA